MFTKRKDVIEFANNYLQNITIKEIINFAKPLKLEITKEQISAWLFEVAKANGVDMVGDRAALATRSLAELDENMLRRISKEFVAQEERKKYQLNEKDYDMYARALGIYGNKCLAYCHIIEGLSDVRECSDKVLEQFDITVKGNNVLTSDLVRILAPLKKNYELAVALKLAAENYATYLYQSNTPITGRIRTNMPTGSLLNLTGRYSDESIELTEKQKLEREEKRKQIMRNALCRAREY